MNHSRLFTALCQHALAKRRRPKALVVFYDVLSQYYNRVSRRLRRRRGDSEVFYVGFLPCLFRGASRAVIQPRRFRGVRQTISQFAAILSPVVALILPACASRAPC